MSGGTLALVEHSLQTDRPGALRWLADAGLIEARGADRSTTPPPAPAKRPPRPSATADLAVGILAAAAPADDTPAREYLARRWTWPPLGTGPDLAAAAPRFASTTADCPVSKLTAPPGATCWPLLTAASTRFR